MTEHESLMERIRSRCVDDAGCWSWQGYMNRNRTPVMKRGGVCRSVRRWVYELSVGPVRDGFEVVNTCECKGCCNPDHLKQTPANFRRRQLGANRPRPKVTPPGGTNGLAKLDIEKARYIRASDESAKTLAARFGVSRAAISLVRRGRSWVETTPFRGLGSRG